MTVWNWVLIAAILAVGVVIWWFGTAVGRKHPDVEPENFGKVKLADVIWPIIAFLVTLGLLIGAYTQADFSGVKWPSLFGQKESDSTVSGNSIETVSGNSVSENTADTAIQTGVDVVEAATADIEAQKAIDDPDFVYPEVDEDAYHEYWYGIEHKYSDKDAIHPTYIQMDKVKKSIAHLYGSKSGDMLVLPPESMEDWPLLEQIAKIRPVTAKELEGLDLNDWDAVEKFLAERQKIWTEKKKGMTADEYKDLTLEATVTAIINDPVVGEAYLKFYMGVPSIYEAGKEEFDRMAALYEQAYSYDRNDGKPVGRAYFLEQIAPEQVKNKESWKAGTSEQYYEEIAVHLCAVLMSDCYDDGGLKKLEATRHYCLPMATSNAMRHSALANYTESREALVREHYGKNDGLAMLHGINTLDLRPEEFAITQPKQRSTEKVNKPNPWDLLIEYKYNNENGPKAAEPHQEKLNFGDRYSVKSPVIAGYHCNKPLVEGTMPAGNVHVIVVYTKITSQNETTAETTTTTTTDTTDTTDEDDNPPGDEETPPGHTSEDGEGVKKESADPVHNNNANYNGGDQEQGTDNGQNISTETEGNKNYDGNDGGNSTPTVITPTTPDTSNDGDTVHEAESVTPPSTQEAEVVEVIVENKTENSDGTVVIVESESKATQVEPQKPIAPPE